MRSTWIAVVLGLSLVVAGLGVLARAGDGVVGRSGVDRSGFDTSVRPQDDFFRYVNGGWIARAEIPADRAIYGSFLVLREQSEANLRAIIEELAAKTEGPDGSEASKIGLLYKSFLDEARANGLGFKPIEADLARIDAIADKAALITTEAALQREGARGLFGAFVSTDAKRSDRYIVYLSQGGISLPDESYYREEKFKPIREQYLAHLEKMLDLAGIAEPKTAAARVMAVETALAGHHWDRVKNRDRTLTYNKVDRKGLEALAPLFNWNDWLTASGIGSIEELIVRQPDYMTAMSKTLESVSLDDWKLWLYRPISVGARSVIRFAPGNMLSKEPPLGSLQGRNGPRGRGCS